jgi:hypothetical protein
MASKSDYLEWQILEHVLKNVNFVAPLQTYVGLMTAVADGEDSSFTEVTGGSYVRESGSYGTQTPTGSVSNTGAITFTQASADWGTVIGFGVFDAVVAGNLLYWGYLGGTPQNFATSGSDDQFYAAAHGFANEDDVRVEATPGGSLPSGIVDSTTYFVVSASVDVFQLSAISAGVPIDVGAGSGVVVSLTSRTIQEDDTAEFADGAITVVEA